MHAGGFFFFFFVVVVFNQNFFYRIIRESRMKRLLGLEERSGDICAPLHNFKNSHSHICLSSVNPSGIHSNKQMHEYLTVFFFIASLDLFPCEKRKNVALKVLLS